MGMLVLGRTEGQRIILSVPPRAEAAEIVIEVCRGGKKPRIGTFAPADVTIEREEIRGREVPKGGRP